MKYNMNGLVQLFDHATLLQIRFRSDLGLAMLLSCFFNAFNQSCGHFYSLLLTVKLTVIALIHEAGLLALAAPLDC